MPPARPFARLCDPDMLSLAWAKVLGNNGCAGGDGQSVADFARRADANIARLAARLADGSYAPRALRRHDIRKADGGIRPLVIPSVSDRIVQRAVAALLQPLAEATFSDASYGYRPGRSVQMAVDRVSALRGRGLTWVLEADIERAFECVPQDRILARVATLLHDSHDGARVLDLIGLWLEQQGQEAGTPGLGLAQGSPLSPLLFNLLLDGLDETFEQGRAALIRFADDFLILTASEQAAHDARAKAGAWLARHGLRFGEGETRVVDFDRGFTFLGRLFVRSLVLPAPDEEDPDTAEEMRQIARSDDAATAQANAVEQAGYDPGGRVLYVIDPARRFGVRAGSIVVTEGDTEILRLSRARVGRVDLGPGVQASADDLRAALAEAVPVAFVDGWGQTLGMLAPPETDGALHLAQAAAVNDPDRRLTLARALVEARLRSMRTRLAVLNRRRGLAAAVAAGAGIGRALAGLARAQTVEGLRGHEARGAALYWPALAEFATGRPGFLRRRLDEAVGLPEPDAQLNTVLDAAAGMLLREVQAAVLRAGLHPGMAFLHGQTGQGLVWDLAEPWRAVMTEGLAVALFTKRRLAPADFRETGGRLRLSPDGMRVLIGAFEAAMAVVATSPHTGKRHTARRRIVEESRALAHALRGGPAWAPGRQDS